MNNTEKNQKLFSSGGIFVDVFIGFLIVACVAGILYRCFLYDPAAFKQDGESYVVYFEIENAHESYAQYLQGGDVVYDEQTGMRLGTLVVHDAHAEGSAVAVAQDELVPDAPLAVQGVMRSAVGSMEQGTLVIGGSYMLTPGQVLEIYTDTVSVSVRILQITEHSEEK